MEDKTRLELEIEHQERYKIPISVKILTVLLLIALCAAGVYIYNLKQNLLKKEQELTLMKDDFQKEKVELLSRIKQLEAEGASTE
jgi:hypothetical protein